MKMRYYHSEIRVNSEEHKYNLYALIMNFYYLTIRKENLLIITKYIKHTWNLENLNKDSSHFIDTFLCTAF